MDRIRKGLTRRWLEVLGLVALVATGSAPTPAQAQFGPTTVTLRVVDQNGTVLNGSVVQLLGTSTQWTTPTTVTLDGGIQIFTVSPAFQGPMFPGGFALPTANNGLQRADVVMLDGSSPTLDFTWQTAQVAMSVVDQGGAAIPGARWGFDGEGATFAPGTITAPINDPNVYAGLTGPSAGGWHFAVQAAFAGASADLFRADTRNIDGATSALAFEWRQASCNMGVVDGTGAALRGATWTMLGHTFAEGDAITLPVTDAALYPSLSGALAAGIPTTLATNTPAGTGTATFAVLADGSLAPASVTIGGAPFALRCGVTAPPPITTGTLAGAVTKDGAPFAGAALTVVDAASASHALTTDGTGAFTLADVPQGAATVTLTIPAGTHGVDPANGQRAVTIVAGQTATANFSIATDPPPPSTGTLAGVVTKDGVPFAGAVLNVVDAASAAHLVATDGAGTFTLANLPLGTATVTLSIPAGTHAVDPASGQLTAQIVAEKTANVSFSIATDAPPPPLVDNPETRDYWWHNARSAQKGNGKHEESFADMRTNFPQAIFDQFANDATDPVIVQGVTEVDPDGAAGPQAPRRLSIDDIEAGLNPSHPSNLAEAKSELLVVLLNVVSNRLSLGLVVDAHGTTLAQEIRILAAMINSGSNANAIIARGRARGINSGHVGLRTGIGYGRRDDGSLDPGASTDVTPAAIDLAPAVASLSALRQPDASVRFAMALPAETPVSLDVYDVTGRHVAQLWHGTAPVGITSVSWSHGGVRAGMYFARMSATQGAWTAKVLVTP